MYIDLSMTLLGKVFTLQTLGVFAAKGGSEFNCA